jgi:hypothetical protein
MNQDIFLLKYDTNSGVLEFKLLVSPQLYSGCSRVNRGRNISCPIYRCPIDRQSDDYILQ